VQADNFTWKSSVFLCIGSYELDLHSYYIFQSVNYNVSSRVVTFNWVRRSAEYVPSDIPSVVKIELKGVDRFKVFSRDSKMPFTEDDCLSSFGYDCDEDWADGQFWTDSEPEDHWWWSFSFQSEAEFLVQGEKAHAEISC